MTFGFLPLTLRVRPQTAFQQGGGPTGQKRDEWVSRIWDLAEKAIVEILKWWLGG
jgi:hypothetical protein